MPSYLFEHPKTGEVKTVYQSVHDKHVYEEDGVKWNRVFTVPTASVDTKIDADDPRAFIQKTKDTKGKMKDIYDHSQELSLKREKKFGKDPVKEKFFKDYSKKRKGRKHPADPSRYI